MRHTLPPKAKKFCIMTIILANAVIVAVAALSLLSGCQIPGGSGDCSPESGDDCPVQHWELVGTWCNTHSPQTCLTVSHPDSSPPASGRYLLQVGLCYERGDISGGLEFTPDTTSRVCLPGFTHGLWSASASFTATGIYLYDIDQCQAAYCDGTPETTVWANDLVLDYTGR